MSQTKLISREFLQSNDVLSLASSLLGMYVCTRVDGHFCKGRIVETEAYRAPDDKASHAYGNKKTDRTTVMFEAGGISYVYLCYGIHNMLNVVTGSAGNAHAILIRGVEPVEGLEIMQSRRKVEAQTQLMNGPGKLCQAMGISREHNARPLWKRDGDIWIEEALGSRQQFEIYAGPRVGIKYAQECAHWPWRFYIEGNRCVSKPLQVRY